MKKKLYFSDTGGYDNNSAHNTIKTAMMRKELLDIRFFNEQNTNYNCAWVGTKNTQSFKYYLRSNSLAWLMRYIKTGQYEDAEVSPTGIGESEEDRKSENLQFNIVKLLIEQGDNIQFVPLFRENNQYIRAIAPFLYGKLFFKLEKTEEVLSYLREHNIHLI